MKKEIYPLAEADKSKNYTQYFVVSIKILIDGLFANLVGVDNSIDKKTRIEESIRKAAGRASSPAGDAEEAA